MKRLITVDVIVDSPSHLEPDDIVVLLDEEFGNTDLDSDEDTIEVRGISLHVPAEEA
jgi:hypothetical protein